jgi:hypothetical protein
MANEITVASLKQLAPLVTFSLQEKNLEETIAAIRSLQNLAIFTSSSPIIQLFQERLCCLALTMQYGYQLGKERLDNLSYFQDGDAYRRYTVADTPSLSRILDPIIYPIASS